ncbi:MAG TPA: hypothetical protein VIW45_19625, partial [Vicinamibacterales bacterium]
MKKRIALALLALAIAAPSFAYKEEVHRVISLKAFDRMTADLKLHLGVEKFATAGGTQLRVLMGQGAYDEDAGINSLNHFLDPVHNAAPLSVRPMGCIPAGQNARDWAIWAANNNYCTEAARYDYQVAVLGPNAATRDAALNHLFLSLGHSIHLVQDMAQPEHVRNDQHLPFATKYLLDNGTQASIYEEWGLVHLLGKFPAVSYDDYPNVSLPTSYDYFTNANLSGLADFANGNFVTQDTNYDDEKHPWLYCHTYSQPDISTAAERIIPATEQAYDEDGNQVIVSIKEKVYTSFPFDHYVKVQEEDIYHDFFSSVDLETRDLIAQGKYSLGDGSYLTRASMLIPRAVGYSAGYLDHFFRGKMEVTWSQKSSGNYDITIKN